MVFGIVDKVGQVRTTRSVAVKHGGNERQKEGLLDKVLHRSHVELDSGRRRSEADRREKFHYLFLFFNVEQKGPPFK